MAGKTEVEGFKGLLAGGLPDLGPGPRADVMPQEELDKVLGLLLGETMRREPPGCWNHKRNIRCKRS